jgi:glycosyltransferase involved in cell wall biosynthesis
VRIVLDLQGAQGSSKDRGIGRYSLALAQAVAKNRGTHEVYIVLSGLLPDGIQGLRAAFDGLLPQCNILTWHGPSDVAPIGGPKNTWRRHAAELMREAFLASLKPDVVHISSMFEGFGDDAAHSIGLLASPWLTAVTVYDLIPLINSDTYLKPNPSYEVFYREKLAYLKQANLFLAISESSRNEVVEHLGLNSDQAVNIFAAVTDTFKPVKVSTAEEKSIRQRYKLTRPFLMYAGATDERKNHLRLIKAYALLPASLRSKYQLAIVGKLPDHNRLKFEAYAKICGLEAADVVVTDEVTDKQLLQLYNLCALFVFPAWHEGFGLPVLEAMSCGAPVVGANTSSVPEVIGRDDALFDPFDAESISKKMAEVLSDDELRADLARHGLMRAKQFSWDDCAKRAIKAFELQHAKQLQLTADQNESTDDVVPWLIAEIARLEQPPDDETNWLVVANAINQNHRPPAKRQLLIDISELVHRDSKTGVQRVVRSILTELLANPPHGFLVEPVYAIPGKPGYRYARAFKQRFEGVQDGVAIDELVEAANGDIFLGLDLQHHVVLQQATFYSHIQNIGGSVYFVVYDLLPVLLPEVFSPGLYAIHAQWLDALAATDGVVCISRAVADEFCDWLNLTSVQRQHPLKIGWFHLGADVSNSLPGKGMPSNATQVLQALSERMTFLMVGTIEPRKGQLQTLLAFEQLWQQGVEVNLVIVGKAGWDVDLLLEIIRTHQQLGHRLFWLDAISDEYLERIYAASTCLIAGSEGEGFGLPLIEAAQHGLSLIARDIQVFREVAGDHAFYFDNNKSSAHLAEKIAEWILLFRKKKHPQTKAMRWLTWKQSTQQLLDTILEGGWYRYWMPDAVIRYCGSDERLSTLVGQRSGKSMVSTGVAGCLVYGPYITMKPGAYRVQVYGAFGAGSTSGANVDVAINKAAKILFESSVTTSFEKKPLASFTFTFVEQHLDFEVRVFVEKDCQLAVTLIEIVPLPENEMDQTDAMSAQHI